MRLNLGCGHRKLDGYVNVDSSVECSPDLVMDLEHKPWPWENSSIDRVEMHHVLEHLGAHVVVFKNIVTELYRVCRAGAIVNITVPHPRSDGFLGDPTHVRAITPPVLALLSQETNRETITKGWPNTPLGLMWGVNFKTLSVGYSLQPRWNERARSMSEEQLMEAVETYFNVVSDINIELMCEK